jgi:hypothetical protein
MRSFDAIDRELSALTVREAAVSRALESVSAVRGKSLGDVDAALDALGVASVTRPTQRGANEDPELDMDALFEDIGVRPSMHAPMQMEGGPVAMPDLAPSAAGDLAGLLEGSNSLMPPPLEETLIPGGMPAPSKVPAQDEYEEMRLASDESEDPLSTEIEILED